MIPKCNIGALYAVSTFKFKGYTEQRVLYGLV